MIEKRVCVDCGKRKNHSIHMSDHRYVDPRQPGLNPIGAGRTRFSTSEAGKQYEATKRENRGRPCEMRNILGEAAWFEAGMQLICAKVGEHLHEILPRGRAGGIAAALRDGPEPVWLCDNCNSHVSAHPKWAKEHGLLLSRKDIQLDS